MVVGQSFSDLIASPCVLPACLFPGAVPIREYNNFETVAFTGTAQIACPRHPRPTGGRGTPLPRSAPRLLSYVKLNPTEIGLSLL